MDYNNIKFINQFKKTILNINPHKVLFVCSNTYDRYGYRHALDEININSVSFSDFEPCPEISSVDKGVEAFKNEACDFIIAVGGGSAIDVAKAIKFFAKDNVKILAVATTAGTGAEVTRFSVLYKNGDKSSVSNPDIIPDFQIFDYNTLKSLPYIQKAVTGLDAFSHAVEAYWSAEATDESCEYSKKAMQLFKKYYNPFIENDESSYEPMMKCSELAGRAINIARTTACHAFSYKLHKLKGFYHGQAVAICLVYIWRYMLEKTNDKALLEKISSITQISGYTSESLEALLKKLNLFDEIIMTQDEFNETVAGVDIKRLSNHPMSFSREDIKNIYGSFIKVTEIPTKQK